MGNSANRYTHSSERADKRESNAESFTSSKSELSKAQAQTHLEAANVTDKAITMAGSKTFASFAGGAWGLLKGALIGGAVAFVAINFIGVIVGLGAAAFTAIALYKTVKGAQDSYYHQEANYTGQTAKRVGDKIMEAGNAKPKELKPKQFVKAMEMAHKEKPKLSAAELQAATLNETESTRFRDAVDASRVPTGSKEYTR